MLLNLLTFSGITTTIAVYRGKSSMYEYILAGTVTGAMYKFNMGLRGICAGAIVGGALGTLGGAGSLLILKTTGMTMEEMRYWQYKWRSTRDDNINDSYKSSLKGTEYSDQFLEHHDKNVSVGTDKLDIKILDQPNTVITNVVDSPDVNK